MTRVKICGITNKSDALNAAKAGADAIGFVFAESPRRIAVKDAARISAALGPWIATVGVFVNEKYDTIIKTADQCRLTAIQLSGDEPLTLVRRLKRYPVIKAVRVGSKNDLLRLQNHAADAILLDACVPGVYGGSGKRFDWGWLDAMKYRGPFILSGGLNVSNVAMAVRRFKPYGVDVSSGVEKKPGIKNHRLVKEFIQNAKNR